MAYVLTLFSCSQFIMRALMLEGTPLYVILNPYVLLMPLTLIWLGDLVLRRRTSDKNLLAVLLAVGAIQAYVLPAYYRTPDFVSLYTKAIQFFWGPALLLPCLLGLFRVWQVRGDPAATARTYLKYLSWIVASVTFLELFAVHVFGVSPLSIPWIAFSRNSEDINPFRPFGVSVYPQINAIMLALLFWLSYLYGVKGALHRVALVVALVLSLGVTGQLDFLILLPLGMRRPVLGVIGCGIIVGVLVGFATITSQHSTRSPLGKFDLEYTIYLAGLFYDVLSFFLSRLSADDIMFGSQTVTALSVLGLTHDWAYIDVFYAYGLIGLVGYILFYGTLIFLACPRQAGASRRGYFAIALLAMNFHYGALNYFLSQILFSTLAALQWQSSLARSRIARTPIGAVIPPGAVGA